MQPTVRGGSTGSIPPGLARCARGWTSSGAMLSRPSKLRPNARRRTKHDKNDQTSASAVLGDGAGSAIEGIRDFYLRVWPLVETHRLRDWQIGVPNRDHRAIRRRALV